MRLIAALLALVLAALGVVVIPYCALAIGQQTIPSGLSGILYSTMPLFTLLSAHVVLHDERLGVRKVIGIGLGIGVFHADAQRVQRIQGVAQVFYPVFRAHQAQFKHTRCVSACVAQASVPGNGCWCHPA